MYALTYYCEHSLIINVSVIRIDKIEKTWRYFVSSSIYGLWMELKTYFISIYDIRLFMLDSIPDLFQV